MRDVVGKVAVVTGGGQGIGGRWWSGSAPRG